MYQDKMAMISAFRKLVLLFVTVTAEVTSALNSPVPVVHTVSNVTLISGKEGTLTCNYNRTVYAVYWRYESTTSPMELLVALDKFYEEGKISGPGYDEGRFNITSVYSLIIHDVQATDEGKYICEVADYETGQVFRNHTDVTTVVIAERPFIRIEQCEDDVSADEISESCSLHTTSDDRIIQLTCTVVGAKPMVDLTWEVSMSSEHWKQVMNTSILINKARANGIFDQTLTVNVDTSHIKSNKQPFTCVGKGLAVDGMANYSIAVYPAQVGSYGTRTVAVSVVCTLVLTFVIIGVLWTWWRVRVKRRNQTGEDPENQEEANILLRPLTQIDGDALESKGESGATPAQSDGGTLENKGESDAPSKNKDPKPDGRLLLERKRRKIKNYQPHKPTTTNKATAYINIGVFGVTNTGKSSFINSLIFALTGIYPATDVGATAAYNTKYAISNTESIELTDHINIINFKGMMNFELGQVGRFFREIKTHRERTRDTPKGQIYCPIFVCDYSTYTTYTERCRNFLKRLSDDVCSYFGRGITVVVTKKNTVGGADAINLIKGELSEATEVTKNQIWFFENYTRDNHEEDVERSIEFLNFILQCLDVVQANQQFRKVHRENIPFNVVSKNTHHALYKDAESNLLSSSIYHGLHV